MHLNLDNAAAVLGIGREARDWHTWGQVESVNADGAFSVRLNGSVETTRCSPGCTAAVGDRVLVCCMADGRCVAVCRLGGDSLSSYPIGAVYISFDPTSPASMFGGEWVSLTGVFPYFNAGTGTGGSNVHALTAAEMAQHKHAVYAGWGLGNGAGDGLGNDAILFTGGTKETGWRFNFSGQSETFCLEQPHNNMPAYQEMYAWRRKA